MSPQHASIRAQSRGRQKTFAALTPDAAAHLREGAREITQFSLLKSWRFNNAKDNEPKNYNRRRS